MPFRWLPKAHVPDVGCPALKRPDSGSSSITQSAPFQYPGLVVMDRRAPDEQGVAQVLFFAKVFERGKDRSFVERSDFRHDGTGWRYVSGVLRLPSELKSPPEALTLATFPE